MAAGPARPTIVVATPGAEPPAEFGYAGAVLLDTPLLLRPDLRAAEEALRRWLNVVALVRSGADGGSVIAVGESSGRALQALVRVDPAGFAARSWPNAETRTSRRRPRYWSSTAAGRAGRVRLASPAAGARRTARTGRPDRHADSDAELQRLTSGHRAPPLPNWPARPRR